MTPNLRTIEGFASQVKGTYVAPFRIQTWRTDSKQPQISDSNSERLKSLDLARERMMYIKRNYTNYHAELTDSTGRVVII